MSEQANRLALSPWAKTLRPSGARLRAARERAGLTQQALGQLVGGVSQQSISAYEAGVWTPRDGLVVAMALALDVDVAELCKRKRKAS